MNSSLDIRALSRRLSEAFRAPVPIAPTPFARHVGRPFKLGSVRVLVDDENDLFHFV